MALQDTQEPSRTGNRPACSRTEGSPAHGCPEAALDTLSTIPGCREWALLQDQAGTLHNSVEEGASKRSSAQHRPWSHSTWAREDSTSLRGRMGFVPHQPSAPPAVTHPPQ